MMNRNLPCILAFVLAFQLPAIGQQTRCADEFVREQLYQNDPHAKQLAQEADAVLQSLSSTGNRAVGAVVTIPVVVHVVYNTPAQNISDQQIASQIAVLNQDFRALNTDLLPAGHPFKGYVADCELEFCLAQVDPSGNPTSGITRTQTADTAFDLNNLFAVKFGIQGGHDNWDPTRYLNMWICHQGTQIYGYSTYPEHLGIRPEHDGIVVNVSAVGTFGNNVAHHTLGRVATHEVAHWLGLRHIWGDSTCGDDQVTDTPPAEGYNEHCPSFPHRANNNCGGNANGEMFMNYMDYVDDGCMNMFTLGQKDRMRNALTNYRAALISSTACNSSVATPEPTPSLAVQVSPNPSNGSFNLHTHSVLHERLDIRVVEPHGKVVYQAGQVTAFPYTLDLSGLTAGVYHLQISSRNQSVFHKLVILH